MAAKLAPTWCLKPPHQITHIERAVDLANHMVDWGWQGDALVGYQDSDRSVQLLTGTHRLLAAKMAGVKDIPVVVYPFHLVQKFWGTDIWSIIITAGSRQKLEV